MKFKRIKINAELQRWYNSAKRGSKITADVNIRRMEVIPKARGKEIRNRVGNSITTTKPKRKD